MEVKKAPVQKSGEKTGMPEIRAAAAEDNNAVAQILTPQIKTSVSDATEKLLNQETQTILGKINSIYEAKSKDPSLTEKDFKEINQEIDKLMRHAFLIMKVFEKDIKSDFASKLKTGLNGAVDKLCAEVYGKNSTYIDMSVTEKMGAKLREEFDNVDSMHKVLIDMEQRFGKGALKSLEDVGIMLGDVAAKMNYIKMLMRQAPAESAEHMPDTGTSHLQQTADVVSQIGGENNQATNI